MCYENIFWQNYLFHSSKEVFLHNFTQFLENWIFEGISTGADLTKMVKICIILICAKKIFFGKIIYLTHQKKCFSTILRNFWRNIDTRGPYKNGENLNFLKLSKEIIFWLNYLFHSSKEEFLHNFRQFSKNWIFEGISTGADLKKMAKICIILICAKKILFVKIICSIHQRKCFSTILRNFWKIEFLKEYRQAHTLQNGENLNYLNLFYEYIFWQNYLFHSSKEVFLHNFTQFLENWIFEGISTGAIPYKNGEYLNCLKLCKENIFVKIICSTHQRKCSSTF